MAHRGFWGNRKGVTAIEFALLATPFFLLLLGTLEVAAIFLTETSLTQALETNVRIIRTGAAQTSAPAVTAAQFQQRVCNTMRQTLPSVDCARLYVDVQAFGSFGASSVAGGPPISNGQFDPTQLTYNPGGGDETILARAYYEYRVVTPMLSLLLANLSDNVRLLQSTDLFRSEPFT